MPLLHVPPTEKDEVFLNRKTPVLFPQFPFFARAACLFTTLIFGLIPRSQAGLVYWGSEGFVENADSRDRVWTADFTMELGVFKKGFVPMHANREQWSAKWIGLSVAVFDAAEARFAGVADLSKPLPSDADTQVYFWAKNGEDLTKGPEWLLVTRPDWKWPSTSPSGNPAVTWTTGAPATAVIGGIDAGGRHLTSLRVAPVPIGQAAWLAGFFLNKPGSTAPDADPDGDGISNRLEYFLGSDPSDGSSTLARNPYAETEFGVEVSSNLKSWSESDPLVIDDSPDRIEVSIPSDPQAKSAFFRIRLEEVKP
jgi:hypothetical protein